MTYTAWIDEEPSYEPPIAPPARSHLRLAGAALVGLCGVAAAAVVIAWAFSAPSGPAFDEKAMALRAAQLAADAASEVEIPADPEPARTSTALSILPNWLYDPTPLAGPVRPKAPVTAAVPVEEPAARAVEMVRAVPLPIANPLTPAERLAEESATALALQDPRDKIAIAPVPQRNPLLSSGEQVAALPPTPGPVEPTPAKPEEQQTGPQVPLPGPGDKFALYDIKGKTVYMPSGEKLEAHSGYGEGFDSLDHVAVRMVGPTPPNIYTLKVREKLFHGVEALRMTPVGEGKMYGRDGFLTHSYLMGPRGDSNGCISFKDYDKFLAAYKRGDVNRIVVVASLPKAPGPDNPLLAWLAGIKN